MWIYKGRAGPRATRRLVLAIIAAILPMLNIE